MSVEMPSSGRINNVYREGNYRSDSINPFPGSYRGRVEFTADPLRLGRIKVRIPQLHGVPDVDEEFLTVKELPWAYRENKGYGGYDMGSYVIPPVGSIVWVRFEAGEPDKMIYGGGVHHTNSKQALVMGVLGEIPDEGNVPAGRWESPIGECEIPKDVFEGKDEDEPTRDVLYKSRKGHTIVTDEEDEKESMSFIDRAGQIIRFISPLKKDKNRTGDSSFKRGTKDSIKGDQFDYENDSFMKKAVIIVKDLAGQIFRMVSEFDKEKIDLVSRDKKEKRQSAFQMKAGVGDVNYLILAEDKDTKNKVYIKADATIPKLELVTVLEGKEQSRVELNVGDMNVHLTGKYKMKTKTGINVHSLVGVNLGSDTDINLHAKGNYTTYVNGTETHNAPSKLDLNPAGASFSDYSGEKYTPDPPSDEVTWIDDRDEDFIN